MALVSAWGKERDPGRTGPQPLDAPDPLSLAAPCLPVLPMKATLTWWDLVVSLNEAANAQELRSHIYNLWKKKGQLGQQHPEPQDWGGC